MNPPAYEDCLRLEGTTEGITNDEWFEIMQLAKPDLTEDEYEAMWSRFQQKKAEGKLLGPVM